MSTPSLRKRLTHWVVLPLLVVLLLFALWVYRTSLKLISVPSDRALRDIALILQDRLRSAAGGIELNLSNAEQVILLEDPHDELFYAVRTHTGQHIAGHKGLPSPPHELPASKALYYDGHYLGQPVRLAALPTVIAETPLLIIVAETMHARHTLSRETTVSLILPLAMILLAGILWLGFGLQRALYPLARLRDELAKRHAEDLTLLDRSKIPSEIQPLVDELNALLARLAQAQDLQRRFIADAAHQLRTPLASLHAYAELIHREQNDPALLAQDLERLRLATARTIRLVEQLLKLARTEPGASQLHLKPIALDELIRTHAPDWLQRADQKTQTLEFAITPAHVWGDAFWLGELMDNLLDNALRYTPDGGRIVVGLNRAAQTLRLTVQDNGPGIPAAERTRVFERFVRLSQSPEEGSGLGLAIVAGIARLHGATVSIESGAGGQGTCMVVDFPATLDAWHHPNQD